MLIWSHFGPFSKYTHVSYGFKLFYTSLGAGWGHFGVFRITLGPLLVHDGDFGLLWGHFGVRLELLLTDERGLVGLKSEKC